MIKFLNLIMFLFVIFFIFTISKYYFSNKNINLKKDNRSNIDQILKEKINNLPILLSDTNDVIIFNDSLRENKGLEKKRSFWDLFRSK